MTQAATRPPRSTERPSPDFYATQQQRAADWYGLRPFAGPACPRIVAGEPCHADERRGCICQVHRRLLDHGRMWTNTAGQLELTGEPYSIDGDDLLALLADLAPLGLNVVITARSMWHPGRSVLVRITKREAL